MSSLLIKTSYLELESDFYMKAPDIGCSLFLMALGGFAIWQSIELSIGGPRKPGPGFFPFCVGILLMGMALINFLQGVNQKPDIRETGLKRGRVILAVIGLLVYSFVLDILGYLLSTFFFMLLLLILMVKKKWWFGPIVSCLISLASYIFFKVWLKVILPHGLLGF